jgi:hypothetical protein
LISFLATLKILVGWKHTTLSIKCCHQGSSYKILEFVIGHVNIYNQLKWKRT